MTSIKTNNSIVHFGEASYSILNEVISDHQYSKIIIIVDSNTHEHCLPYFLQQTAMDSTTIEIIEFQAGEVYKNIETCSQIWSVMSELEIDRKALIINLGGGVVTDLGGFIACTYKRGLDYINVPTSLLAMVDASVGGKTGVDLGMLKNQIGVISEGLMVIVDTHYLKTLSSEQMRSGLAEMLKHGLIKDRTYWNQLKSINQLHWEDLNELIYTSVRIKQHIVSEDPKELGLRKALNFGHTLGHAIESYHLESTDKKDLLHGEAIAIGMVLESYISHELNELSKEDLSDIQQHFRAVYGLIEYNSNDISSVIDLLKHDKKNSHGIVKFALLEHLGKAKLDCQVSNTLIKEAFEFYQN